MFDRETVIKAVEYLNWYFTQDDGTADKNAVKAWEVLLQEQEAVEPKVEPGLVPPLKVYRCGHCDTTFLLWRQKYCAICGKPVKWE